MKLIIDRAKMLDRLGVVAAVVPTRSPKPVLAMCKLAAQPDGSCTLMATDLEVSIRCVVPGTTADAPGAVLLPPARFAQILKTTNDDTITLEVGGDTIKVAGSRARFELPSEDAGLYPDVPDMDGGDDVIHVAGSDLRRLIRRTAFATDVESTRYALGGVLFQFDGELYGVGTDGRRLSHQWVPAAGPEEAGIPEGAVLPLKALKLIERAIGDGDAVKLDVTDKGASVYAEGVIIHTRLVEGRFPRYQDVFPEAPATTTTIDAGTLLGVTEQAQITTSDESRGIDYTFADGELKLNATAADVGHSDVNAACAIDGPGVSITFDGRYLVDAMRTLTPDTPVKVELIDHKSPCVLRTDDGLTYVVMPLTRER